MLSEVKIWGRQDYLGSDVSSMSLSEPIFSSFFSKFDS